MLLDSNAEAATAESSCKFREQFTGGLENPVSQISIRYKLFTLTLLGFWKLGFWILIFVILHLLFH